MYIILLLFLSIVPSATDLFLILSIYAHLSTDFFVNLEQPYHYKIMKISNLLTTISAISFSQFGEAVDNFPHTGTSLVEKNPYPPAGKDIARSLNGNAQSRDDISLANENEDISGCTHMDVSAVLFFAMDL